MAIRKSRAQCVEVLAKFEASPRTLTWWRWRLRREGREVRGAEEIRLVAVDVPQRSLLSVAGAVRIVMGEIDVRVDVGTDVSYVAALVAALRSRC